MTFNVSIEEKQLKLSDSGTFLTEVGRSTMSADGLSLKDFTIDDKGIANIEFYKDRVVK